DPGKLDVQLAVCPVEIERVGRVAVAHAKSEAKAGAVAGAQARAMRDMGDGMHELFYFSDGAFSNLRMGSLNADLGRYFGADSGVLVLENRGGRIPELKGGDVIVSVAGKRVNTPSEVMRQMRSGTPGASVNVEILRDKKRQVVAVDVPEHGPMLLPLPPEPPAPPAPPAAPAAGIAIATLANHALASWLGAEAAARLPHATLVWLVALSFAAVGLWALKPDRIEDDAVERGGVRGAFAASLVAFFLAEMGDKTQIATVVLAAQYQPLWQVLLGTTLGLMAANAPVLWLG